MTCALKMSIPRVPDTSGSAGWGHVMRRIHVIGIGAGDPGLRDRSGRRGAQRRRRSSSRMPRATLKDDLVALRREICERFIREPGYRFVELADPPRSKEPPTARPTGRPSPTGMPRAPNCGRGRCSTNCADDGVGAFLAWGDPSLYDSTLRILDMVADRLDFDLRRHPRHHRDPGAHRAAPDPAQRRR